MLGSTKVQSLTESVAFILKNRDEDNHIIVGTSFVVHREMKILYLVTCRHVIELANEQTCQLGMQVHLLISSDRIQRIAKVHSFPQDEKVNIVVLRLDIDDDIKHVYPFVIASAEETMNLTHQEHAFISYGYNSLKDISWRVHGNIEGGLEKNTDIGKYFMIHSPQLTSEMSGSPVLDLSRNLVIGIITHKIIDSDTAIAIDCKILEDLIDGFRIFQHDELKLTLKAEINDDEPLRQNNTWSFVSIQQRINDNIETLESLNKNIQELSNLMKITGMIGDIGDKIFKEYLSEIEPDAKNLIDQYQIIKQKLAQLDSDN